MDIDELYQSIERPEPTAIWVTPTPLMSQPPCDASIASAEARSTARGPFGRGSWLRRWLSDVRYVLSVRCSRETKLLICDSRPGRKHAQDGFVVLTPAPARRDAQYFFMR
jgi:hypothetical protein